MRVCGQEGRTVELDPAGPPSCYVLRVGDRARATIRVEDGTEASWTVAELLSVCAAKLHADNPEIGTPQSDAWAAVTDAVESLKGAEKHG